ncbi:hypothetical protein LTR15_005638 [Elasticomyces elasticus]|nr:hypothetical protein LTR15_005638 [Elasticomyces elasticus]
MAPPSISTQYKILVDAPDGYSREGMQRLLDEIKSRGIDIEAGDIPLETAQARLMRLGKGIDCWTDEDVFYELSEMFEVVQQATPDKGYHRACSDKEAASVIRDDIAVAESLLGTLRQMCQDQGDTIYKRWRKRNQTQRAALLRAAMPDIYPSKSIEAIADVQALFDERVSNTATKYLHEKKISPRKCWLVPYLNIETMVEGDRLLQLLVVRTRYGAQQHLSYDLERTDLAFVYWHVKILYNPHAVVMCEEAGNIGDLVQYDADMVHRGDVVGFPRAQLAFEAQKILYTFLTEAVKQLLAGGLCDPPPGSLALETAVAEASTISVNGRSSYNVRAFSKPLLCDFVELQEILQPLMKAVHDEMWLAQTDVMYFRDKLAIPEAAARFHKAPENMRKELLLRSIIEIVDDVNLALKFESRMDECMAAISEYAGSARRGRSMPDWYNQALSALQSAVSGYYSSYQNGLASLMARSTTFRHALVIKNGKFGARFTDKEMYGKDRLLWSFMRLCRPSSIDQDPLERSFHLHYIDDLLQSPKERRRIDQTFYDYFSRMLALDEAVAVLKRHVPYADDGGQTSDWLNLTAIGHGLDNRKQRCRELETLLVDFVNCAVPTTKPTLSNLSWLKNMHEASSRFWEELILVWDLWREVAPRGVQPCGGEAPAFMRAFKSVKHLTEFQLECDMLQSVIDRKEATSKTCLKGRAHQALASTATQTVWGAEAAVQSIESVKIKVKTRSEGANDIAEQLNAVQLNEDNQATGTLIAVKHQTFSIFTRMYAVCGEAKADIKWPDLAAAFVDAGLSAVHAGGSAVTFRHPTEGAIVFHRPHPDPNVKPVWLRTMGKRLNKWFGWSAETFVERE